MRAGLPFPGGWRWVLRPAAALAVGFAAVPAGATRADAAEPLIGAYSWDAPSGPANIDLHSGWLGREVDLAEAFEAADRWDNIDGAEWQLGPWSGWVARHPGRNLVLTVPLLAGGWDRSGPDGQAGTADDVSLETCAAGGYDRHWTDLADMLARYRLSDAFLRLGHEFNGNWYTWRAEGAADTFAGCFRAVVEAMRRARPEAGWRFVWNPTVEIAADVAEAAWPGDSYVDIVGIDIYDQSWRTDTYPFPDGCDAACRDERRQRAWQGFTGQLALLRDFAVRHGKPLAVPEWGVAIRDDGHGGGDNPFFIRRMHDFITNPANDVVFHVYFDVMAGDGAHQLSGRSSPFPEAAAAYRELFGAR